MPSKPQPIEVHWRDIYATAEWHEEADAKQWKPYDCVSVGYMVHESKGHIVLADSYGEGGYGGLTAIPRGCIVKPERLCKKI